MKSGLTRQRVCTILAVGFTFVLAGACDNIAPTNALSMFNDERAQREHERQLREQRLILEINANMIVVRMLPALARAEVEHVRDLAQRGVYDGTRFHRVDRTPRPFVIQGGDPLTKGEVGKDFVYLSDEVASGKSIPLAGTGGAEFPLTTPTNNLPHAAGTMALASREGELAGSQFFFALDRLNFLDGNASVFGVVESGWNVIEALKQGDKITRVYLEEPTDIDIDRIGTKSPQLPTIYEDRPNRGP